MPTGEANPTRLADRIKELIRVGEVAPGELLVQESLAERFGCSRGPIREALRVLHGEGFVSYTDSGGAMAAHFDPATIDELYELRLGIEPRQAGRIVVNCSPRRLEELEALANGMAPSDGHDVPDWWDKNHQFHRTMYSLIDRPVTIRMINQLLDLVEPYSRLYVSNPDARQLTSHQHVEMIECLRAGDDQALAAEIEQHLAAARDDLLRRMSH